MYRQILTRCSLPLLALGLTACGGPIVHDLKPLPGKEAEVPEITEVTEILFETTAGEIHIAVYPEAAPNAAARFVELVESGYYDNTPVSRVVDGFVAQFGINWREPHKGWREQSFDDDPRLFAHERGTLSFAKSGLPNTAATQVFINLAENNRLAAEDPGYQFTVFGHVITEIDDNGNEIGGMAIVDQFVRVGDPTAGLDQNRLWSNGDAYLASLPVKPTMILSAKVL